MFCEADNFILWQIGAGFQPAIPPSHYHSCRIKAEDNVFAVSSGWLEINVGCDVRIVSGETGQIGIAAQNPDHITYFDIY